MVICTKDSTKVLKASLSLPEGVRGWWVGRWRPRKLWAGVGQKQVERGADADVGEVEKLNSWSETNHGLTFAGLAFFLFDKGCFFLKF